MTFNNYIISYENYNFMKSFSKIKLFSFAYSNDFVNVRRTL